MGRLRAAMGPAAIAVVAVVLLAPFVHLDPVRGVTFSNAPFSDEGWNLVGARNLVLFGHPSTDSWNIWLLSLPFTAIQAPALALFGLEITVARLINVGVVGITGWLLAWGFAPAVGQRRAWLAGLAYVTCGLVLFYGRLAFLEPLVGLLLVAAVVSLVAARSARPVLAGVLAGVALGLTVMTKGTTVVAVAAIVLVVGVTAIRVPWARRWLTGAVATGMVVAGAWAVFVLLPNRDAVATVMSSIYPEVELPAGLRRLVRNAVRFATRENRLLLTLPLVVGVALGGVRLAILGARRRLDERAVPVVVAAVALVASLAGLIVVNGLASRYLVAFLPLAAVVGAWAVPERLSDPGRQAAGLTIALALAVSLPGVVQHATWFTTGGTELERMQDELAGALPNGATVVGAYAPLVALGAPVRTVVLFGDVNDEDWYARGARFVVAVDDGEPPRFLAGRPEVWSVRRKVACFEWANPPRTSCLYELPDPAP